MMECDHITKVTTPEFMLCCKLHKTVASYFHNFALHFKKTVLQEVCQILYSRTVGRIRGVVQNVISRD